VRVGERLVNRDEDLLTAPWHQDSDESASAKRIFDHDRAVLAGLAIAASSWSGERTTDRPTVDPPGRLTDDSRARRSPDLSMEGAINQSGVRIPPAKQRFADVPIHGKRTRGPGAGGGDSCEVEQCL
jgi:hypothetical protein